MPHSKKTPKKKTTDEQQAPLIDVSSAPREENQRLAADAEAEELRRRKNAEAPSQATENEVIKPQYEPSRVNIGIAVLSVLALIGGAVTFLVGAVTLNPLLMIIGGALIGGGIIGSVGTGVSEAIREDNFIQKHRQKNVAEDEHEKGKGKGKDGKGKGNGQGQESQIKAGEKEQAPAPATPDTSLSNDTVTESRLGDTPGHHR